jgi:hypothetical protein
VKGVCENWLRAAEWFVIYKRILPHLYFYGLGIPALPHRPNTDD